MFLGKFVYVIIIRSLNNGEISEFWREDRDELGTFQWNLRVREERSGKERHRVETSAVD